MSNSIIFLAGIHGVGKGHLAERLRDVFSLDIYSASALIREEKKRPVDTSKYALDPDENQDLLVAAIDRLNPTSDTIILDGHFVLMARNDFFYVPLATFENLSIEMIILKTLGEKVVYDRLSQRDGESPEIELLANLQEKEIKRAEEISSSLNVPLVFLNGDDYSDVVSFIDSYLEYM